MARVTIRRMAGLPLRAACRCVSAIARLGCQRWGALDGTCKHGTCHARHLRPARLSQAVAGLLASKQAGDHTPAILLPLALYPPLLACCCCPCRPATLASSHRPLHLRHERVPLSVRSSSQAAPTSRHQAAYAFYPRYDKHTVGMEAPLWQGLGARPTACVCGVQVYEGS